MPHLSESSQTLADTSFWRCLSSHFLWENPEEPVQEVVGIKDRIQLHTAISDYCQSKSDLASHQSILFYAKIVERYFKPSDYLDTVTTQVVEQFKIFQQKRGYANQTVKHLLGLIRGVWMYSKRLGYQVSDLEFPKMKVDKGRLRYMTFEEEKRLLEVIDPKREMKGLAPYDKRHPLMKQEMQDKYDFIIVLLDTGARHGEIRTLEWSKVNLTEKTISLWRPKVKNESILYMTD